MERHEMSKRCFEVTVMIDDVHYWFYFENVTAGDVLDVIESNEFSSVYGEWLSFTHSFDKSIAQYSCHMKRFMSINNDTIAHIVHINDVGFTVEEVGREV